MNLFKRWNTNRSMKWLVIAALIMLVTPVFAYSQYASINITETAGISRYPDILRFNISSIADCTHIDVKDSDNATSLPFNSRPFGSSCTFYVQRNITGNSNFLLHVYYNDISAQGNRKNLSQLLLLNETFNDGNSLDNSTGYNWTNINGAALPIIENGIANFSVSTNVVTIGDNNSAPVKVWNNYTVSAKIKGGCNIFYFDGTQPPDTQNCGTQGAFMFSSLDEANFLSSAQPNNNGYWMDTYISNPADYRFFTRINNVDIDQGNVAGNLTYEQDIEQFFIWEISVNGSVVHARSYNETQQQVEKYYTNITRTSGTIGFEDYDVMNVSDTWDIQGINVDFVNVYPTENYATNFMTFQINAEAEAPSDTTAPNITMQSPTNTTYSVSNTTLNYSVNETATCQYELNGAANVTLTGCTNTTFTAISGTNIIKVFAIDASNNTASAQIFFTFTFPPAITGQVTGATATVMYLVPLAFLIAGMIGLAILQKRGTDPVTVGLYALFLIIFVGLMYSVIAAAT